jgi:hypothetical protein
MQRVDAASGERHGASTRCERGETGAHGGDLRLVVTPAELRNDDDGNDADHYQYQEKLGQAECSTRSRHKTSKRFIALVGIATRRGRPLRRSHDSGVDNLLNSLLLRRAIARRVTHLSAPAIRKHSAPEQNIRSSPQDAAKSETRG